MQGKWGRLANLFPLWRMEYAEAVSRMGGHKEKGVERGQRPGGGGGYRDRQRKKMKWRKRRSEGEMSMMQIGRDHGRR